MNLDLVVQERTQKKRLRIQLYLHQYLNIKINILQFPKFSSQNRRYIPMDYLDGEIIPGDKLFTMPNASFYEFGVLMSNVHMAWMRAVCGRLKSDYSYSNTIVYNNFPWPVVTEKNRETN